MDFAMRYSTICVFLGLWASACVETDPSVAPDTVIDSQPDALTNISEATFFFSATGAITEFRCAFDGGVEFHCESPVIMTLPDGEHTFAVAAVLNNAVDATPATYTWRIDTNPPDTEILTAPPSLDNNVAPEITFDGSDAEGSITFECALDGGAPAPCTSPHVLAVADGSHTFSVTAIDEAGNRDATPATHGWEVTTATPDTTITSGPTAASTSGPSVSFEFTSPDVNAVFECALDGGAFAACTSPIAFGSLSDGSHTFEVRAVGVAGPDPSPASVTWTVDATGPVVTITTQPTDPSNDTTPQFAFTADETATFECQIDGVAAFAACTSPFESPTLADGGQTFRVRATDLFGNLGNETTVAWVIDTVAPTVTITVPPAPLSNDATPSVTFTTAGNPATIECAVDGGTFAACTSIFTSGTLPDGDHAISVRVTDAAGNSSTATTSQFTIDTVAPTVTLDTVPAALSNDNTPTVTFTVGGGPATTLCRVDNGAFTTCTGGTFTPTVSAGTHTITVQATDGAGNSSSTTTGNFTVDLTAPTITFDDAPPADWPVDYYDIKFSANETSTFTCSLNGAAATSCTSPQAIKTTYGTLSSFRVTATDTAGNSSTKQTAWTSTSGLVLHYAWEQGSTANSSLLAQSPAFSPDGTTTQPFVGGWAGTALGSTVPAHDYAGTDRPLTSSPDGGYTASFWIRPVDGSNGKILSTAANGGLEVSLSGGTQLAVAVFENGVPAAKTVAITPDRWTQIGLRTTGPAKGLQIFVDGVPTSSITGITNTGFDVDQSTKLLVGNWTGFDVDDLRFFNRALSDAEMCTVLARGTSAAACLPIGPGFELDFEGSQVKDTGIWRIPLAPPPVADVAFGTDKTGGFLRLLSSSAWGYSDSFQQNAVVSPGRSFSFWFTPGAIATNLIDFTQQCAVGGPPDLCGIRITYANGSLSVLAGAAVGVQPTATIATPQGVRTSVVVTEQHDAVNKLTTSISVYVNGGAPTVIGVGTADIYANANNTVQLLTAAGVAVDEYEFWTRDLGESDEMLCENGFGGLFDPSDKSCALTSN